MLQDLHDIFTEVRPYLSDPGDPLLASFGPAGGCVTDYDDSVNLHFHYYERRTGKNTQWGPETLWNLRLIYEETTSDEFDYDTVIKETMITHRLQMNHKETIRRKARFKVTNMVLTPHPEEQRKPVLRDILALRKRGRFFAKATSTLETWACSGLDMQVRCSGCWKQSLLRSVELRRFAEAGMDKDGLRSKLTCLKCRRSSPFIKAKLAAEVPSPFADGYDLTQTE